MSILNFYANHTLDFVKYSFDELQNKVISQLNSIAIPDDIIIMGLDTLKLQFPREDLTKFYSIKNWCPFSFSDTISEQAIPNSNIALIGQMGMSIVFTPKHILLPTVIDESADWYSPNNKDKVQVWRRFYYAIIKEFGGDHALYVDGQELCQYYDHIDNPSLQRFEKALEENYGSSNKSMFDYSHGEFPEYYIDTFTDFKALQS